MVIVSKQLKIPTLEKQLSDYAEGDIIKIPEDGVPVEFYVAKHDYESELNGPGRTLVVRKDTYDDWAWHNSNVNAYANSYLNNRFNNAYKDSLDADIRSLIGTTKIRYTPGNGNWTVDILERAIFALSLTELGQSDTRANVEGSALPIASTLLIAYHNGSVAPQWTRSPVINNPRLAWVLIPVDPFIWDVNCVSQFGARPAFTLPSTTKFNLVTNIIKG